MSPPIIVIFGALVRPDGTPSPALARRIAYALEAARAEPEAPIFCSGAAGAQGPSEAAVMAEALTAAGVAPGRLVLDEASGDTLQSALAAARFVSERHATRVVVCSEGYHLPRIRLLMRALGVRTTPAPRPLTAGRTPLSRLPYMAVREAVAIPYDLILTLWRRPR